MKKFKALSVAILAVMLASLTVQAADITAPGDVVQPVPNVNNWATGGNGWPAGETVDRAFDNSNGTKYLHRIANYAASGGCGLRIAPAQKGKIVVGLNFTSANDAADRDPRSFILRGSNTSIDGPYTDIASGTVNDFIQTAAWPRQTRISAPITFSNTVAYDYYELMIPTVRSSSNLMQVAEIELLDNGPTVNLGADRVVRVPNTTLALTPSVIDLDSTELTYAWSQISGPGTINFNGTQTLKDASPIFPAVSGLYELQLIATDEGGRSHSDTMIVRLWDPAVDDALIAHWKFNEGAGTTVNDSTAYNDLGTMGRLTANPNALDPNWVTGWIPTDGAENFALNFRNLGYVEVVPVDPNDTQSNLLSPEWGITISAWMNPTDWNGNRRIMQKGGGDNQYRVLAEWGAFKFHLAGVGTVTGPLPKVKQWHHVAATYDGSAMKLYIDGVETASLAAAGRIGVTTDSLFIGTKGKTVTVEGDYFKGAMDDLRIYNYALTPEELYEIVALGENAPPVVSIEQPDDLNLSLRDYIDLDATVFDVNNNPIAAVWTASDASVTFEDSTAIDTRAFFTTPGSYTLRLTVNDGYYGLIGDIFAEVTVTVTSPTCADVIADGLLLEADMNQDCRIDLLDIAMMIQDWLNCNDPTDPACTNPYASPTVD